MIPAAPKLTPDTPAASAELVRLARKVESKLARQEAVGPDATGGRGRPDGGRPR